MWGIWKATSTEKVPVLTERNAEQPMREQLQPPPAMNDDLLRFSTSRSKSKKKRKMHVHHRSNQSISIKEEVEQNGRENGEGSAMETHGGVF